MTGTIVLASKRGFYFVAEDETSEQFFLHASAVAHHVLLKSGDRIRFDLEPNPRGRARAIQAEKIVGAADIVKDESNEQTTKSS